MTIPILLVPGLSCTPEVWRGQIDGLWTRGPVTVASHTRGTTIAEIATQLLESAPPRFALAGISMGGYISFEIWRQARERVLGIALVDTNAGADSEAATVRRRAALKLVAAGRFSQVIAQSFPTTVHPDHVDDRALYGLHVRMNEASGTEVYTRQQGAIMARVDSRPDLKGIDVPALVLVGEADQLTPPAMSQEIAQEIPGAELVVVGGAGHMALVEKPAACTDALLGWLDRIDRI